MRTSCCTSRTRWPERAQLHSRTKSWATWTLSLAKCKRRIRLLISYSRLTQSLDSRSNRRISLPTSWPNSIWQRWTQLSQRVSLIHSQFHRLKCNAKMQWQQATISIRLWIRDRQLRTCLTSMSILLTKFVNLLMQDLLSWSMQTHPTLMHPNWTSKEFFSQWYHSVRFLILKPSTDPRENSTIMLLPQVFLLLKTQGSSIQSLCTRPLTAVEHSHGNSWTLWESKRKTV